MASHYTLWFHRFARAAVLALVAIGSQPASAVSSGMVISQVYGGGSNSSAAYNVDYLELFNRGNVPVNLTGWSFQYQTQAGTTWTVMTIGTGTVPAGGYYLVRVNSTGATGAALPAADAVAAPLTNLNATQGKFALVNSTVALASQCPSPAPTLVDLVAYGTTSTICREGSANASAPPNNGSATFRAAAGCTDTDQNSSDFASAAANPRNSATPVNVCGGPVSTPPTGIGSASPASGAVGASTTLTVTVTPGANPVNTNITVVGNLTAIGGANPVSFLDDGVAPDLVAGDKIYTVAATIGAVSAGAKSIGFTVADNEAVPRTSTGSIAFTVDPPTVTIAQIQGSGHTSPLNGQLIKTSGVVTGVKNNGYFLQMAAGDGDPNTSDGIFVFTSSTPPAGAVPGNRISVVATVQEFPVADPAPARTTELVSPAAPVVLGTDPLPAPIPLTAADTDPNQPFGQNERYEGMLVSIDSLTVVAPTGGNTDENDALGSSDGNFYGVITGIARPYREPGIPALDVVPSCGGCTPPVFDENPERIRIDSDALGGAKIDVATGAVVTGIAGPLETGFHTYSINLLPGNPPQVVGGMTLVTASGAFSTEFAVAMANVERFYDTVSNGGDVALTPTAYQNRLNKLSLMIRDVLKSPHVVAFEEVENLAVIQAIAAKVNADSAGATNYVGYLSEGNDIGLIDSGFIVDTAPVGNGHQRVEVVSVTQYNKAETYINPTNGNPELLNDRPPLVLRANVFHESGYTSYPVTVVVNHMRSLNGAEEDNASGNRVRVKRRAQAESLARLLDQFQDNGENVVSVGDYNVFQFNDGMVDSMATIIGNPTPATDVVLASPDLVSPNLTIISALEPAEDQYSFSFDGNAQELDHMVVNDSALGQYNGMSHPRVNADFPEILRSNALSPHRISDHDPAVAYFLFPVTSTLTVTPDPQQYTDLVTFHVVVAPDTYQGNDLLPATVEFFVDGLSMGTATLAAGAAAGTLEATLADVALVEPLPSTNVAPGAHTVTAIFSNALIPDATAPLTITKEDANASYAGALFVSTACATCSNATVALVATVLDNADANTGDIRNATVTFINLDNNTAISPALPVGLVNAGDTTVGIATYNWNTTISGDSQDFTIGIRVDNYYTRTAQADAIVTVSKPLATEFITGGGYLTLVTPAGIVTGDVGSKNNFGFNVKYNKKGSNLQGRVNTLVRRTEAGVVHTYQIKGTALSSLSVNAANGTATFSGKAVIRDVTNPLAPVSIDGNATLLMTMDDNGEPGSGDLLGITILNKQGGLWFSSNWTGSGTATQAISAGNLVVH